MSRRRLALASLAILGAALGGCSSPPNDGALASGEDKSCCSAPVASASPAELPGTSLYLLDSAWTDHHGQARRLADFSGEVVVTAMIFTNCEYACPMIESDLERIEDELSESALSGVRFLLVSMDAERDTPEVLHAHAEKRGLDKDTWTFLHGDAEAVRGVAAVLGIRYKRNVDGNFAHSNMITVLHRDGRIADQLEGLNGDVTPIVETIEACVPTT